MQYILYKFYIKDLMRLRKNPKRGKLRKQVLCQSAPLIEKQFLRFFHSRPMVCENQSVCGLSYRLLSLLYKSQRNLSN